MVQRRRRRLPDIEHERAGAVDHPLGGAYPPGIDEVPLAGWSASASVRPRKESSAWQLTTLRQWNELICRRTSLRAG